MVGEGAMASPKPTPKSAGGHLLGGLNNKVDE